VSYKCESAVIVNFLLAFNVIPEAVFISYYDFFLTHTPSSLTFLFFFFLINILSPDTTAGLLLAFYMKFSKTFAMDSDHSHIHMHIICNL